ncbi:hypothetical protein J6590_013819, partial [Homalodisca vitripennis]
FKCTLTTGQSIAEERENGEKQFPIAQHRTAAFERLPSEAGDKTLNKPPQGLRSETNLSKSNACLRRYLVASAFYVLGGRAHGPLITVGSTPGVLADKLY